MAANDHTESPEGLELPQDATESCTNPNPAVPSIEDSLKVALDRKRAEFAELRAKVAALPVGHPDRRTHARIARVIGRDINDTLAILDRRHWQEFAEDAPPTLKRRGRPSKAMLEARKRAEEEGEGEEG